MDADTQVDTDYNVTPLGDIDADEQEVAVIRRHPAGIISLYALTIFGIVAGLMLTGFVLPSVLDPNKTQAFIITLLVLGAISLAAIFLTLATIIYFQSKLVVTNKNITQVLQRSLFNKATSQLSMASVEDVTAIQKGIFATYFKYGTLIIETAGEQANFHFEYCPRPRVLAKQILEARERFIEADPDRAQRANERLHVPH
jgi:hypothetical protein